MVGGEQLDLADRAQVQAQGVEARLDGEVDLRPLDRLGLDLGLDDLERLHVRRLDRGGFHVARDHLDADFGEVAVQLAQLVVREVELLEACGDLVVGQVATLLTFRDQFA